MCNLLIIDKSVTFVKVKAPGIHPGVFLLLVFYIVRFSLFFLACNTPCFCICVHAFILVR